MEIGSSSKCKSPESAQGEENNNEERNLEEYERNISMGIMELKNLGKEVKNPGNNEHDRRRVLSNTIDKVLKSMHKLVDLGRADGFVYGIIPKNGKPISAASENLQHWWKEKVRFDRNGPAAIVKYQQGLHYNVNGSNQEIFKFNVDNNTSLRKLHELLNTTIGALLSCLMTFGCNPNQRRYVQFEIFMTLN